jgi:hypothetical protein
MTEMIKNLLRNAIRWAMETPDQRAHPQQAARGLTSMIREGNAPLVTVWPISNGYLIVGGSSPMMMSEPTITYVKDITEIGEQIATMQARVAIGVPNNARIGFSQLNNRPNYAAVAQSNP